MAKTPRETYLLRRFGITEDQYNALLVKQGGGCAICGKTPEEEGKNLAVDHNHKTLEVMGIACAYCNRYVIGRHLPAETVERLLQYLRGGTGWFVPKPKRKRRRKPRKAQ